MHCCRLAKNRAQVKEAAIQLVTARLHGRTARKGDFRQHGRTARKRDFRQKEYKTGQPGSKAVPCRCSLAVGDQLI